jgi:hypothetical protein
VYCPECGHHNRESARFCGRCGASLIELTEGEATVSFTPPAEPGADSGVMEAVVEGATLVIRLGGGRAGDQFPVGPSITSIGRAPESDVFLDDVTVSRDHALLVHRGDGWHLDDLGSLNGTYVNRERIESRRLTDADELQVGKYKLTFLQR